MGEADSVGMEEGALESCLGRGSVEAVAGNGVAEAGEVGPYLVSAAGPYAHLEIGEAGEALQDFVFGDGWAAFGAPGRHIASNSLGALLSVAAADGDVLNAAAASTI